MTEINNELNGTNRFAYIASKMGEKVLNETSTKETNTEKSSPKDRESSNGVANDKRGNIGTEVTEEGLDELDAEDGSGTDDGESGSPESDSDEQNDPGDAGGDGEQHQTSENKQKEETSTLKRKRPFVLLDQKGEKNSIKADTKIQVMVDGKIKVVPLEEVVNQYSGKEVIEKQLHEARETAKQTQVHIKNIEEFQSKLNETFQALNTPGKTFQTLRQLVSDAGIDPFEFEQNLMNDVIPEWVKLAEMTPAERENIVLKQRLEYNKTRGVRETAKTQENQGKLFQSRMKELTTEHKFAEAELTKAGNEIQRMLQDGTLAKTGIPLTPDLVANLILRERADSRASAILKAVDPGIEKIVGAEKYNKEKLRIGRLIFSDPDTDDEDLLDSARLIFASKIREAQKAEANKDAKAKSPAKPSKPENKTKSGDLPSIKQNGGFQDWLNSIRG